MFHCNAFEEKSKTAVFLPLLHPHHNDMKVSEHGSKTAKFAGYLSHCKILMEETHTRTHLVRRGALHIEFSTDAASNLNVIVIPGELWILTVVIQHCAHRYSTYVYTCTHT